MAVTPDDAMAAIRGTGGAQPGHRALHAKGRLYRGGFTATAEGSNLCRAAHLDGSTVPALVRFSNGSGRPDQPDNVPFVRGLAIKLMLPDGSTTDISAQTAPLFLSSTPEDFIDLLRALRPGLALPFRVAMFAATHLRVFKLLRANAAAQRVPESYATVGYHALHAYRWIGADGESRFVRYHLVPNAGEQFLTPAAAKANGHDFLTEELQTRLAAGPVEFDLQVQIAGPGDSTVDPSARWASRQIVTVGTLRVVGIDTEREHGDDIVVFDPLRVTDGIEPSADPVLHFRSHAYSASVKLRTGVDRGPEAPQT